MLPPPHGCRPADARFIGSPVDYVIFAGLTRVADEKESAIRIVFMDVKQGKSTLNRTRWIIRDAVMNGQVAWETLRVSGEENAGCSP